MLVKENCWNYRFGGLTTGCTIENPVFQLPWNVIKDQRSTTTCNPRHWKDLKIKIHFNLWRSTLLADTAFWCENKTPCYQTNEEADSYRDKVEKSEDPDHVKTHVERLVGDLPKQEVVQWYHKHERDDQVSASWFQQSLSFGSVHLGSNRQVAVMFQNPDATQSLDS